MTGQAAGVGAAARATAAIVDSGTGQISGQGLAIGRGAEAGGSVLTCHHVIASIAPANLRVRLPGPDGELGEPLAATVVAEASDFAADVAVLSLAGAAPPGAAPGGVATGAAAPDSAALAPELCGLDASLFAGPLDATGISYLNPARFDGVLRPASPLAVPVRVPGAWEPAPAEYRVPHALRLTLASDAREGISGSPVVCQGAVVGLAHFARAEGPKAQREVYVVPLSAWAERLPALQERLTPLVDRGLGAVATVRLAARLAIGPDGPDIVVAGYRPDVYLRRGADRLAARALGARRGTIVVGKPKSGKTRLALELLRADPGQVVIIPRAAVPPDDFEAAGLAGRPVTLLFDDLHRSWLTADPVRWVRLIADRTGADCRVVATARDGDDWDKVQRQPGTSGLLDLLGPDAVVYCSRQPAGGDDLSAAQANALASQLGLTQTAVTARFDGTPGSLVLDLAAMKARYGALRQAYVGDVAMSRLLDAAKLLHACGQPQILLDEARYVAERIRGDGPLSPELWEHLLRRTRDEGFGAFRDGTLQTYRPYLEECVSYEPARDEAERLFQWYADRGNNEGVAYIGGHLHRDFDSPLAEQALRMGMAAGDAGAREWLPVVLSGTDDPGKQAEAERLFKENIEAGHAGYNTLALHYARQGRKAEAEETFRAGIAAGEFICHFNLGNLLAAQPGRLGEAEAELRAVFDAGFRLGAVELAEVLARQERLDEAEAVLRTEIERAQAQPTGSVSARYVGAARAWQALGRTLVWRGGAESEAADAFRAAISLARSGDFQPVVIESSMDLGSLLAAGGAVMDEDAKLEAEECLRTAASRGHPPACDLLGQFLWRVLDERDEAVEWFRKAAAAGLAEGHEHLGICLYEDPAAHAEAITELRAAGTEQHRATYLLVWLLAVDPERTPAQAADAEAERLLRALYAQGVPDPQGYLWYLLDRPGREADYEAALAAAARRGDADATGRIFGRLYGTEGRAGELEEVLRASVAAGNARALPALANVVGMDDNRVDEAESLFRRAIEAGVASGHHFYGMFLCMLGGRDADAERELRQSAAEGTPEAWRWLGVVLARMPGREDDARQAQHRAAELGVWTWPD